MIMMIGGRTRSNVYIKHSNWNGSYNTPNAREGCPFPFPGITSGTKSLWDTAILCCVGFGWGLWYRHYTCSTQFLVRRPGPDSQCRIFRGFSPLLVIDAMAKPEPGILEGGFNSIGSQAECFRAHGSLNISGRDRIRRLWHVGDVEGRYCQVRYRIDLNSLLESGIQQNRSGNLQKMVDKILGDDVSSHTCIGLWRSMVNVERQKKSKREKKSLQHHSLFYFFFIP